MSLGQRGDALPAGRQKGGKIAGESVANGGAIHRPIHALVGGKLASGKPPGKTGGSGGSKISIGGNSSATIESKGKSVTFANLAFYFHFRSKIAIRDNDSLLSEVKKERQTRRGREREKRQTRERECVGVGGSRERVCVACVLSVC